VLPAPYEKCDREAHMAWISKNWEDLVGRPHKIYVPSEPDAWADYANLWVDGCGSSPSVKNVYRNTIRDLASLGITPHTQLTHAQVYEWTKRDVSVKNETILKNADKSPRQILAASPQFVVLTTLYQGFNRGSAEEVEPVLAPGLYARGVQSHHCGVYDRQKL